MIQCLRTVCVHTEQDILECVLEASRTRSSHLTAATARRGQAPRGLETGPCLLTSGWQLPFFFEKTDRPTGLSPRLFCSQEEPLCLCSAIPHPARGARLPKSRLQPPTCLPSWPPTPTCGLQACVEPMGHTAVSNSSLRPPVSDRPAWARGGLHLLGLQQPGTDSTIPVVGNRPRLVTEQSRQVALFIFLQLFSNYSDPNPRGM